MGLFSKNPEKQAKKEEEKELRRQLQAAGRINGMVIHHISGFPKHDANTIMGISQGVEVNTLRLNGYPVTVTGLEWGEQSSRSVGKAAAGAIVGGALTGGLGLIAGAAIGGKKSDNSTAVLSCTDGVVEYTVYLRADAEKYQKLASLL